MTPLEFRIYEFLEWNFVEGASEHRMASHFNDVSKEEVKAALDAMVTAGKIGITTQGNQLYYL